MDDDVDELPDSDFSKSAARLFDKIDNGKAGVIPSLKFVEFIETLCWVFCSTYMEGHLHKLDPN